MKFFDKHFDKHDLKYLYGFRRYISDVGLYYIISFLGVYAGMMLSEEEAAVLVFIQIFIICLCYILYILDCIFIRYIRRRISS